MRGAEKDTVLFVQMSRYFIPVRLDTRLYFHIGTDYIFTLDILRGSLLRSRLTPTPV